MTQHDSATSGHPQGRRTIERQSILRNTANLMSSQAAIWTLALLVSIVQPRFIGPVGQGQLRLAYSVWTIVDVVFTVGTTTVLTLEMARNRALGESWVGSVLLLRVVGLGTSLVVSAGLIALLNPGRDLGVVMLVIGAMTLIAAIGSTARAVLFGLENIKHATRVDVGTKLLQVALVVGVLLAGGRVVPVSMCAVVAAAVNAVLLVRFLRAGTQFRWTGTRAGVSSVVRASLPFFVGELALIVYQQVDTVIMSVLVGTEPLGWYGTADQLFSSLLFLPGIMMTTMLPVLGRLHIEQPERIDEMLRNAQSTFLLIAAPLGLGCLCLGDRIAVLLYGEEFAGTGQILRVLGLVLIIVFQTILVGRVAMATGRQRTWNILMLIGIVLTIPLDLVFVPWADRRYDNGAIGGALSYLVTETFLLVVGGRLVAPRLLRSIDARRVAKIIVAAGAMVVVVVAGRPLPLAAVVALGAVTYIGALVVERAFSERERALITSARRRLLRR